jgi:TolA-binding protein
MRSARKQSLFLLFLLFQACSTREHLHEALDREFFEPISVLPSTAPHQILTNEHRESDSLSLVLADSLEMLLQEQNARIEELEKEVELLRERVQSDSSAKRSEWRVAGGSGTGGKGEGAYVRAMRHFDERRYREAILGFRSALKKGIPVDLQDESRMRIAKSYFRLQQYRFAIAELEPLLTGTSYESRTEALFTMGQSYEMLADVVSARRWYEVVVREGSGTEYGRRAEERLGRLREQR